MNWLARKENQGVYISLQYWEKFPLTWIVFCHKNGKMKRLFKQQLSSQRFYCDVKKGPQKYHVQAS
ncbi:hypothetical protein C0J08_16650 [Marinomonas sp. CT5]|nr:hypothetical protein C0J08_16650 [Marinomonas sp. CT5]